jgi:hypothetical protein
MRWQAHDPASDLGRGRLYREDAMQRNYWNLAAGAAATLLLAACASSQTKAEKLAMYQSHASEPVKQVNYFSPQGWEEIDRDHILVTMRPTEVYLMRLNGPCLDFDNGAAAMLISNTAGVIQPKFDRVSFPGSSMSCRIEEIREIDMPAVRASNANT